MRGKLIGLAVVAMASGLFAAEQPASPFKNDEEKASYSIGMNIGRALKQQGLEVDLKVLADAIQTTMAGKPTLLTDEQAKEAIMKYQTEAARKLGEKKKKEGDTFLAENKAKEGVKVTDSGLQYKIMTPGTGPKPAATDRVTVNYRGRLVDGTEFDSSYKTGEPATFAVNRVIKGWTEALQMMPVGSKWEIYIPSDLAYAENGQRNIPPHSVLIFEVELVGIAEPQPNPAAGAPAPIVGPKPPATGANPAPAKPPPAKPK